MTPGPEIEPGHIGGRRALSPLHHPCSSGGGGGEGGKGGGGVEGWKGRDYKGAFVPYN